MNAPVETANGQFADPDDSPQAANYWAVVSLATMAFLAYGIILASFSSTSFPDRPRGRQIMPYLADTPVTEDGFYMLTLAWNLAAGEGMSYNGGQVTTGTQPLATFGYAALAWVVEILGGGKFLFVRLVIILGTLGTILFAHLTGRLTAELAKGRPWASVAYPFAYLLTLASFTVFRLFTNGLETGLYLLAVALLIVVDVSSCSVSESRRPKVLIGVLIGLAALARIDFLMIVTCWGLLRLLRNGFKAVRELTVMAAVAGVIVSPWFLWVYLQSGHWMPQSGPVESRWMTLDDAADRLASAGAAVVQHLVPVVYSTYDLWHNTLKPRSFTLLSIPLLIGLIWWARPLGLFREMRRTSPEWRSLALWLVAMCSLVLVYPALFWATGFYFRYMAPLLVCILPLLALLCARRLSMLPESPISIRTFGMCGLLLFAGAAVYTFHSGRIENSQSITAGYVKNYYPTAKVATFQSGIIGFFNENTRNLDGKMDLEALKARRQGRIEEYIEQIGMEVIVDWGNAYIRKIFSSQWLDTKWKRCEHTVPDGRTLCFVRLGAGGQPVVTARGIAVQ